MISWSGRGQGSAFCFGNFGGGAKAWCRDGGDKGQGVEPRDPSARMGDGELQCSQARKSPPLFGGEFPVLESVLMSLNGQNHHEQGS